MSKGKVLIVGSNAVRLEVRGGWVSTGQYLNETVVPAMAVIAAGYDVVLATPDGTKPNIDERSDSPAHFGGDEAAHARAVAFYAHDPSMTQVRTLRSVIANGLDAYAAVFVPGGHAPIVDLMQDPDLGVILRHFHAHAKPTALLCHGPIAVVAAMSSARAFRAALVAGDLARASEFARGWPYAGYRMTVYSDSEERFVQDEIFQAKLQFGMEAALRIAGGNVIVSKVDRAPHVIEDRELITGQNPRSDHLLAQALTGALDRARTDQAEQLGTVP
jgi:putative intracellular protease/amidase